MNKRGEPEAHHAGLLRTRAETGKGDSPERSNPKRRTDMSFEAYLAILALIILGAGTIFALVTKERTERVKRRSDTDTSRIATDTTAR